MTVELTAAEFAADIAGEVAAYSDAATQGPSESVVALLRPFWPTGSPGPTMGRVDTSSVVAQFAGDEGTDTVYLVTVTRYHVPKVAT